MIPLKPSQSPSSVSSPLLCASFKLARAACAKSAQQKGVTRREGIGLAQRSHSDILRNPFADTRNFTSRRLTLDSTHSGYKPEQLAALYQALLTRLEAIPGVRSASISGCTPLEGCGTPGRYIFAEGQVEHPEDRRRVGG